MWLTGVDLFRSRFVVGRRTSHGGSDVRVGERQAVVYRLRSGDAREAVFVHRRHQEIAGTAATIAGEHPAGSIRAMCGRSKTQNQNTRVGIAKSRNRFGPVGIAAKRRAFDAGDVGAVRTKSLAFIARDDVAMNVAE